MEYIKSQKGKDQLVLQFYIYSLNRTNIEGSFWRCKNRSCRGRVKLTFNSLPEILQNIHAERVKKVERHIYFTQK